jgi:membrane protein involved in colicin uptake
MAMEWFSCKGACSGSNPVSDTVKVDPALLAAEKENMQPMQAQQQRQNEDEEKRRAQEEFLQQEKEREAERRRVEEQAEKRRREEEAVRRREGQIAAEKAAAAAAGAAAEARAREEQRLEAEMIAKEKARQEAQLEAQRHEEERLACLKVAAWCKENGFADMNSKKKSFMSGFKFPLHEAVAKHLSGVAKNNEEIVGLMIQVGADKTVKNSKGQTPLDLAKKMNKTGSMDSIIAMLS